MESKLQELLYVKIIAKSEIIDIKNKILLKENINKSIYLNSFVNEIYNSLDLNLMNFNEIDRNILKKDILRKLLLKNKEYINAYDILEICTTKDTFSELIIDDLVSWVNEFYDEKINELDLKMYIENKKPKQLDLNLDLDLDNQSMHVDTKHLNSTEYDKQDRYNKKHILFTIPCILLIIIFALFFKTDKVIEDTNNKKIQIKTSIESNLLKYHDINIIKLNTYLINKNSILAEEPYFSKIIEISKEHDIDPILLFAITGQEQYFVSNDKKYALKIANNPFNVYNSWEKYNTNIDDSTKIVARTISKRLKSIAENDDPFVFLNETYAEDENWHKGVRFFYYDIHSFIDQ